jgi:transposase
VILDSKLQLVKIDNAPPHAAQSTKQMQAAEAIDLVQQWPTNSPDPNPIENIWSWKQQHINSSTFTSFEEWKQAVPAAWNATPLELIRKLISSMPKPMKLVQDCHGD